MFEYFVAYSLLDAKSMAPIGSGNSCFKRNSPISGYSDFKAIEQDIARNLREKDGVRALAQITFITRLPI